MPRCESFPFAAGPDARVLVVGSMPGIASLNAGQYYAHPRNAFWPIVYSLWLEEAAADYGERIAFAIRHRIALWDVARVCEREGSLDTAMRAVEYNDFDRLFAFASGIHTVLCNGGTAHTLLLRSGRLRAGLRVEKLPSTSPAYTLSIDRKRAAWAILRRAAEEEKR